MNSDVISEGTISFCLRKRLIGFGFEGLELVANALGKTTGQNKEHPRWRWPSRPDLGELWPSRPVATAEEDRLNRPTQFLARFLLPIERHGHRGALSRTFNTQFGGNALHNSVFGGEPQIRFTSTALVMMVIAVILVALMVFA